MKNSHCRRCRFYKLARGFSVPSKKDVAKQIAANPQVELCCYDGQSNWLRLSGTLVEDERVEAKKAMLDAYPELRGMYDENDDNTAVYYFKDATARFDSFVNPQEIIKLD